MIFLSDEGYEVGLSGWLDAFYCPVSIIDKGEERGLPIMLD